MTKQKMKELLDHYTKELLESTMPFWMKHAPDKTFGGYHTVIGRNGEVLSRHKNVWIHGRFVWLLSTLCTKFEPKQEWLEMATHGIQFLEKYGFDSKGKMYFTLDRDGKPVRMRRYIFAEVFAVMAYAAYSKASKEPYYLDRAKQIFANIKKYLSDPDLLPPKFNQENFPTKGHSMTMIQINMLQMLRENDPDGSYDQLIANQIKEVMKYFVKPEEKALLELVAPDGSIIRDTPEGRTINPGHAIETAWFMLEEAKLQNDKDLMKNALDILDWSLDWGWDKEYGGLFSFVDLDHKTPVQVEADMKYWWPHNESIYATLLAYSLTGDEKYENWFDRIHQWSEQHFPDREHGEWFGYLHRDGTVAVDMKATGWKGPFHLPRQQLNCILLLQEMIEKQ